MIFRWLFTPRRSFDDLCEYIESAYITDAHYEDCVRTHDWAIKEHHYLGRFLRNNFGFWDVKSPSYKMFKKTFGVTCADTMSDLILQSLEHKYKQLPFDPVKYLMETGNE